ncbi:chemotaxis protein CheB [Rhodoplanes sp. Z2-YC6860]|uniref:chemotaxis protein CheB n=1 Tax=Rhodoplanes sp. Z2-YC6860 TaxID=674703 RepID=UPI00078C4684|nr:chemotaxis protein CheB [Rhodoplanes sp. Z2-YC6860]AMN42288.1 protein-glutamate methylesterase protein [Rhodoplanes sp. Z2-YC6860]
MTNRDILAIGTSAGGVEALTFLARHMPADFPAAILVTIHLPSNSQSVLDEILTRCGPLPASFVKNGDRLRKGHFHLAPPDRHLLVEGEAMLLGSGPRESNSRPAIDPMLRSAALCCAPRTVGVVLTGTMSDGASGLWALHQSGGVSVVQDPRDAAFSDMPANALNRLKPDHVVTLAAMPKLLASLAGQRAGEIMPVPGNIKFEVEIAKGRSSSIPEMDLLGHRSPLACPDCHGVMWEIEEGELVRYRCHVGHTYTAEMMALALDENLRRGLGSASRALEERRALARKLEEQATRNDRSMLAASWSQRAKEFEQELKVIRDAIRRLDDIVTREAIRTAAE